MSAPVHRDDETDDFQFYAPPWARERSPSPADTAVLNSAAAPSEPGDAEAPPTSSAPDVPERVVSPATDPPAAEARGADGHEPPAASVRSQAASQPRMAP